MANRKRDVQILLWVTPEEKKMIRKRMMLSKTSNMSVYLRKMAIDGMIVNTDTTYLKAIYMDIHINAVLHIQKICKHPVCQFRCQDLQITDGTDCLSHQKRLVFGEIEGSRCNEVLGLHTGFRKHFVFKPERFNPILIEDVVHG